MNKRQIGLSDKVSKAALAIMHNSIYGTMTPTGPIVIWNKYKTPKIGRNLKHENCFNIIVGSVSSGMFVKNIASFTIRFDGEDNQIRFVNEESFGKRNKESFDQMMEDVVEVYGEFIEKSLNEMQTLASSHKGLNKFKL